MPGLEESGYWRVGSLVLTCVTAAREALQGGPPRQTPWPGSAAAALDFWRFRFAVNLPAVPGSCNKKRCHCVPNAPRCIEVNHTATFQYDQVYAVTTNINACHSAPTTGRSPGLGWRLPPTSRSWTPAGSATASFAPKQLNAATAQTVARRNNLRDMRQLDIAGPRWVGDIPALGGTHWRGVPGSIRQP
eukprot:gene12346-biopygen7933